MNYNGASAGVTFVNIEIIKYAERFAAKVFCVTTPNQLDKILDKDFATEDPVVADISVKYAHNYEIGSQLIEL